MTAGNRWTPATIPARDPVDPDPRSRPISFELTPQERDLAVNARLDIIAMQREANRFTPGLVVKRLEPSDLTVAERAALGIGEDDE